jgi:hypothetical protein
MSITARTSSHVIYLSTGTWEGRATWHYVMVDKLKLPLLMGNAKKGSIDITQYGKILFSGFGSAPPREVTDFIRKRYSNQAALAAPPRSRPADARG